MWLKYTVNRNLFKEWFNEYQTVSGNWQQSASSQETTSLKILSPVVDINLHAELYFVYSKTNSFTDISLTFILYIY